MLYNLRRRGIEAAGDWLVGQASDRVVGMNPERALERKPGGWDDFLTSIKEANNHLISALLEKARVEKFTVEEVALEFFEEGPLKLIDKEKLNNLLSDYLGATPAVKLELKQEIADQSLPEEPAGAAESRDPVDGVMDHPMVKSVRKLLGGKVVEILPETK